MKSEHEGGSELKPVASLSGEHVAIRVWSVHAIQRSLEGSCHGGQAVALKLCCSYLTVWGASGVRCAPPCDPLPGGRVGMLWAG